MWHKCIKYNKVIGIICFTVGIIFACVFMTPDAAFADELEKYTITRGNGDVYLIGLLAGSGAENIAEEFLIPVKENDSLDDIGDITQLMSGTELNKKILSMGMVEHFIISDSEPESGTETVEIQNEKSLYPVYMWKEDGTLYWWSEGSPVYLPKSASKMFRNCKELVDVDFTGLDFSNVQSMIQMFDGCEKLSGVNFSGHNLQGLTHIGGMFRNCKSLVTLDLSDFNTKNVNNTLQMFAGATSLTTIYASENWDMSNVVNSDDMFCDNFELKAIITKFNPDWKNDASMAVIETPDVRGYLTDIKYIDTLPNWAENTIETKQEQENTNPKTGDKNNFEMWIVISIMAAILVAVGVKKYD